MIFQERRLGFLSGALINDLRRHVVYVTIADGKMVLTRKWSVTDESISYSGGRNCI